MTLPAIGIFWALSAQGKPFELPADLVPVAQGEAYGEFLTYGGHYEHWERLAGMGAAALRRQGLPTAPAWSEYEEWPRGRVVFHVPAQRFILYLDRKLRRPDIVELIMSRFGLQDYSVELRGDPHYVSSRPIGPPSQENSPRKDPL